MHSVRRALVQSNRDIGLVNLMQIGEASAEDLEWCTLNRVETSSDLQYISAAHTPKGRTLERLWKRLQRQPSGIVASILQEERQQRETIQPRPIVMRFGLTSSAWSEQASRNFKIDPAHPKPMDHRHMIMCKLPFDAR